MKGRTVRGIGGDMVRVVYEHAGNSPAINPRPAIFVTASERESSCVAGRNAVCAILTPEQALALADLLRELATRAARGEKP